MVSHLNASVSRLLFDILVEDFKNSSEYNIWKLIWDSSKIFFGNVGIFPQILGSIVKEPFSNPFY